MTAKTLPHTCGAQIPVTEHYNGAQLAMVTPQYCPGCGERANYNVLVNLQERRLLDMPQENQSLYQRYRLAVRSHPEAYVVIKTDDGLVAFDHECALFSYTLNVEPKPVNGHLQLTLSPAQVERLKSEFEFDLLEV